MNITGSRKRSLFREVNERIRDVNTTFGTTNGTFDVLCECVVAECDQRILVPGGVYEAVRRDAGRYVVAPGHEQVDEAVVEANGTYRLVQVR